MSYPKVASFKTAQAFRAHLRSLSLDLELDNTVLSAPESPLAQPLEFASPIAGIKTIGNRFSVLPMEGWDGTEDGQPTPLTLRRWQHFGESGAKLIWGGEAVAVRHDGRANPNQLLSNDETTAELENLRRVLVDAHHEK